MDTLKIFWILLSTDPFAILQVLSVIMLALSCGVYGYSRGQKKMIAHLKYASQFGPWEPMVNPEPAPVVQIGGLQTS